MNLKPGDRALVLYTLSGIGVGATCTVVAIHEMSRVHITHERRYETWSPCVEVIVDGFKAATPGTKLGSKPEWLRKIDDGSDSSSWDHCLFKPKDIDAIDLETFRRTLSNIKKLENLKWP